MFYVWKAKPKLSCVCDAHYVIFYDPTKEGDPFTKLKEAESNTLPLSKPVLLRKVKHDNCVTAYWMNAHLQNPLDTFIATPTSCGRVFKDGKYDFLWFEGEQMPKDIAQNIEDLQFPEEDDIDIEQCESDESDYEGDSDILYTMYISCMQMFKFGYILL